MLVGCGIEPNPSPIQLDRPGIQTGGDLADAGGEPVDGTGDAGVGGDSGSAGDDVGGDTGVGRTDGTDTVDDSGGPGDDTGDTTDDTSGDTSGDDTGAESSDDGPPPPETTDCKGLVDCALACDGPISECAEPCADLAESDAAEAAFIDFLECLFDHCGDDPSAECFGEAPVACGESFSVCVLGLEPPPPPPEDGACLDDEEAIATGETSAIVTKCAASCQGDIFGCVTTCIAEALGVSDACGECFGGLVVCGVEDSGCLDAFEACAGVPFPQSDPPPPPPPPDPGFCLPAELAQAFGPAEYTFCKTILIESGTACGEPYTLFDQWVGCCVSEVLQSGVPPAEEWDEPEQCLKALPCKVLLGETWQALAECGVI